MSQIDRFVDVVAVALTILLCTQPNCDVLSLISLVVKSSQAFQNKSIEWFFLFCFVSIFECHTKCPFVIRVHCIESISFISPFVWTFLSLVNSLHFPFWYQSLKTSSHQIKSDFHVPSFLFRIGYLYINGFCCFYWNPYISMDFFACSSVLTWARR